MAVAEPGLAPREHVVLLDHLGQPSGTAPKADVHGAATPFHLAFSCHVVGRDGSLLLARRASVKRTWPDVWSNGCCGHPQVGETLRSAAVRRIEEELGLAVTRVAMAVPDFTYRAEMDDGVVEHELCPVLVVEVEGPPNPDPSEVGETAWASWEELVARVADQPASLSPWCVAQVAELLALGHRPHDLLEDPTATSDPALDRAVWADVAAEGPRVATIAPLTAAPRVDPISSVVEHVDEVLAGFLAQQLDEMQALHPDLAEVAAAVVDLVRAGGKRLRPAFVHWGHVACGGAEEGVAHVAGAMELLHTFALLHDDVMDRSLRRRGRPAAHVALADRHRARAGDDHADSDWFGISGAILAGDLAHVWADVLLHAAPAPPAAVDRARAVYDELRSEVIAGQYLDLRLADPASRAAGARQVALLKSARYTVTRPLLLGAALAPDPVDERIVAALHAYGDAVGLAFQLRDDVLGLFGDPASTGKPRLDDLREGKRTVLVLRALELACPADRALLAGVLGDPDLDEVQAERARAAVARSGALASVEVLVRSLHDRAIAALVDVPRPARGALEDLARLAIVRSA